MRNYTAIERNRYEIFNIFRSQRFDVDRLDLSIIRGDECPEMARGFRIIDHEADEVHLINGSEADFLIFSLAYINSVNDGEYIYKFDEYLLQALETDIYLVTKQVSEESLKVTYLH